MSRCLPVSVAHRLSDLIFQFPHAAIDGVHWQVLARKYEERFSSKLDVLSLGFDSPLPAASALLWDVARVVDATNPHNPVVALEEGIALTPRPGSMGSWPSLYQSLSAVVSAAGSPSQDGRTSSLLLSQLKPLLQSHWHSNIDEHWSYFDLKGSSVKTKKMKHLIHAVLAWRNQWMMNPQQGRTKLHEALKLELELVPSHKHNDLVLKLVHAIPDNASTCDSTQSSSKMSWADVTDVDDQIFVDPLCPYDDPYEPPPQKNHWGFDSRCSTVCSTPVHFVSYSGSSTPVASNQTTYTFVPLVMCNIISSMTSVFGDRSSIPTGTVRQMCNRFEVPDGAAAPLLPDSQWAWKIANVSSA